MPSGAYLLRRAFHSLAVLVAVGLLVVLLMRAIPGDPARNTLGIHATDESVAALNERYGLDAPVPEQVWLFMSNAATGDLGHSFFAGQDVSTLIADRIPVTLWLVGYAVLMTMALTLVLATTAALRPDSMYDRAVRLIPVVGLGMPSMWVGLMLAYLLAFRVGLFPLGGFGEGFVGHLQHLFLPALTVTLALMPLLIRSLRASVLEVVESDYVLAARAKGVGRARLVIRHVLPNAVIPTLSLLAVNIGFLVGGTIIVERVFALPGLGDLLLNAVDQRDFPVVQGLALLFALAVVAISFATDVVAKMLDPRAASES